MIKVSALVEVLKGGGRIMNKELIRIKIGFTVLKLALRILPDKEVVKWIEHVKGTSYAPVDFPDMNQDAYAAVKASSGINVN